MQFSVHNSIPTCIFRPYLYAFFRPYLHAFFSSRSFSLIHSFVQHFLPIQFFVFSLLSTKYKHSNRTPVSFLYCTSIHVRGPGTASDIAKKKKKSGPFRPSVTPSSSNDEERSSHRHKGSSKASSNMLTAGAVASAVKPPAPAVEPKLWHCGGQAVFS